MTPELRKEVDAALLAGERQCDIRRRLGVARYAVARRAKVLRDARVGTMRELLSILTPPEKEWVLENKPKGCTVAALIAGIVKDAIAEEKNAETQR